MFSAIATTVMLFGVTVPEPRFVPIPRFRGRGIVVEVPTTAEVRATLKKLQEWHDRNKPVGVLVEEPAVSASSSSCPGGVCPAGVTGGGGGLFRLRRR